MVVSQYLDFIGHPKQRIGFGAVGDVDEEDVSYEKRSQTDKHIARYRWLEQRPYKQPQRNGGFHQTAHEYSPHLIYTPNANI